MKRTWRAHSGYATYVLGLSSTIFRMPDGRRSATCVLGRICECMLAWCRSCRACLPSHVQQLSSSRPYVVTVATHNGPENGKKWSRRKLVDSKFTCASFPTPRHTEPQRGAAGHYVATAPAPASALLHGWPRMHEVPDATRTHYFFFCNRTARTPSRFFLA